MHVMKIAALFSGGKDSTYALYLAQQRGWTVERLITVEPHSDSMMFHHPNVDLTDLHAEALGIPLTRKQVGGEDEMDILQGMVGGLPVSGLVVGAIASDYQHTKINRMCHRIGLRTFTPLWRKSQVRVLREEVEAGFDVVLVGVSAEGLTDDWLGERIVGDSLNRLIELSKKSRFNVSGEGGEYESLVLDGPNFRKRIEIEVATKTWDGVRGEYSIHEASLADKTNYI